VLRASSIILLVFSLSCCKASADDAWVNNRLVENRQNLPERKAGGSGAAGTWNVGLTAALQESELSTTPELESGEPAKDDQALTARVQALEELVADLSNSTENPDSDALVARLNRLEDTLGDLPDSGGKFLEALSNTSRRVFNGRIHLDTWQYPNASPGINALESGDFAVDPENRVLVRRARIGVRGSVPPDNMSYRLELEFSGQDGGRIRDAWLGWDDLPVLDTIRVGNQKRPYGLDHLNSSNFITFLERPLVVDAINRGNRRVGLAVYGSTANDAWNWQAGLFNMEQIQDTNDIVGDKAQIEFAARLAGTVWYDECSNGRGYAHFGLAGSLAFPDGQGVTNQAQFRTQPEAQSERDWLDTGQIVGATSYQLIGVESVINVGAFQVVSEWMHIALQRDLGFGPDLNFNGGYVSLSYFLTGEHIPWNRGLGILGRVEPHENFFLVGDRHCNRQLGLGAWQIALRLSRADFSDRDIQGGVGDTLTLALNWYWNAHSRLQFNYGFGDISSRRTTLNNGMTPVVAGDYEVAGTRFMIDF